jgi:hypothetical protein
LEKNLKNKYSDSSLLFRVSSSQSQPGLPRQRVTFSTEQFSPSQGAEREAADYKTQSEAGGWGKDSVCWFCLVEGSE